MSNDLAPPVAAGTWTAPAAELEAVLQHPLRLPIDELGLISVSGDDAGAFLQAQLTGEVQAQTPDEMRLNGYCTAKGRLLAVFFQWRVGDAVLLQVPKEVLQPVLKRLRMFVLRSRAVLADASDSWTTLAVCGAGAAGALREIGFDVPEAPGQVTTVDGGCIARLRPSPAVAERFMLLVPRERADATLERLKTLAGGSSAVWWWTQVDAALPCVFASTQEKFVPQMVNLEVLDGVSFRKGCYPGQEVVARSQYLGKLRRRMHVAHVDGATAAGANVFTAGEPAPIGTVVMAARAPRGGSDLLFECATERLERPLCVNSTDGPPLVVRALPYELFDPTA